MPVVLFFVDGLGIGERGSSNPLDGLQGAAPLAVFQSEEPEPVFGGRLVRTDARLGVRGRPQSASGQTTILTGVNAPAAIGYHKQGFPNGALREIISEHSVFKQLRRRGKRDVTFANAYTKRFFERRPRWISATTAAVEAAGLPFRTIDDVRQGRAVFADYTNRYLIEHGEDVELQSPESAGATLGSIAANHEFTLYEYFITDRAGHAQDLGKAREVLSGLASFVRAVLANVNLRETTVMLTSDHGNVEDLSTKNHTLNDVPTWVWGRHRDEIAGTVESLADITPAILRALE